MDNAYNISSAKIIRALAEAEVMSIYFPRVGKTLVIDLRHNTAHGPAVIMDDMVGSAQERLRSLQQLRPGFTELGQLTLAPWLGSVGAFAEQGIWAAVLERFHALGYADEASDATRVFEQLRRQERLMLQHLVAGDPQTTRTVWTRTR